MLAPFFVPSHCVRSAAARCSVAARCTAAARCSAAACYSAAAWCLAIELLAGGIFIDAGQAVFPQVFAATAQADESFAVCTTAIDGSVEGFFMLDFETGDVSGGVLNPLTAQFAGSYKYNVLKDLGFKPGQAKKPRFLLVSGLATDLRRGRGVPLAQSVLYITDSSTGTTAAYGIPWNPQAAQGATPFVAGLELLSVVRPRGGGAKAP